MTNHIIPCVYDLMDLDERYGRWNSNGTIELYRPGFNTQLDKIKFRSFSANIRSELQNMQSPEFVCNICAGIHYIGTGETAAGTEVDYKNYPATQALTIVNKSGKHTYYPSTEYNRNDGCKYIIDSFKIPLISSFDYSIEKLMNYANGKIKSLLGVNDFDATRFATGECYARKNVVMFSYFSEHGWPDYRFRIWFDGSLLWFNTIRNDRYISDEEPYTDSTPTSFSLSDGPNNYALCLYIPYEYEGTKYRGLAFYTRDSSNYLWTNSQTYFFEVPNSTTRTQSPFSVSGCIPITADCKIHPKGEAYYLLSYIADNSGEDPSPEVYRNHHKITEGRTYYLQYYYRLSENRIILNLHTGYPLTNYWLICHSFYRISSGYGLSMLFVADDWKTFYLYTEEFGEIPPLMITPSSDTITTHTCSFYTFPLFSTEWTEDNWQDMLVQCFMISPINDVFYFMPYNDGRNFAVYYVSNPVFYDYNIAEDIRNSFSTFGNYVTYEENNNNTTVTIAAGACSQFFYTFAPTDYAEWDAPEGYYDISLLFINPGTNITELCRSTGEYPPFILPLFDMNGTEKTEGTYLLTVMEIGELKWISSAVGSTNPKWWSVDSEHLNTCIYNACNSYISLTSANLTAPTILDPPETEGGVESEKYYWWYETHKTLAENCPYTYAPDSTLWKELFMYDGESFNLLEVPFKNSNNQRFLLSFYIDFYTNPLVMEFDYHAQQPAIFWNAGDDIDTDRQETEHLPNVYPVAKSLADYVRINDPSLFSRINTYLALQDTDLTLKLISPLAHTQNNIVFYLNESSLIEFKEYETGPSEMKVDCIIIDAAGEVLTPEDAAKIYSNITISLDWQFY